MKDSKIGRYPVQRQRFPNSKKHNNSKNKSFVSTQIYNCLTVSFFLIFFFSCFFYLFIQPKMAMIQKWTGSIYESKFFFFLIIKIVCGFMDKPSRALSMSSWVGLGLFLKNVYIVITMPGVQKPHWTPWFSIMFCCSIFTCQYPSILHIQPSKLWQKMLNIKPY